MWKEKRNKGRDNHLVSSNGDETTRKKENGANYRG